MHVDPEYAQTQCAPCAYMQAYACTSTLKHVSMHIYGHTHLHTYSAHRCTHTAHCIIGVQLAFKETIKVKLTGLRGRPIGLRIATDADLRRAWGWWNLQFDLNLQVPLFMKYWHSGWPGLSGYSFIGACWWTGISDLMEAWLIAEAEILCTCISGGKTGT